MSRFFVPSENIRNNILTITGSDINHIKNVIRKNTRDELICFDSSGNEYICIIKEFLQGAILLEVKGTKQLETESNINITLGQCLPKSSKMDEIIQKSTELGVSEIFPILSERSVAKGEKTERWQKIAKEASEQSGRYIVPRINPLVTFDDYIGAYCNTPLPIITPVRIIAWEGESGNSLKSVLHGRDNPRVVPTLSISIIIGPEGGFSSNEIDKARSHGFIPVSLGKRILRTETAGPAMIAMIMYELEQNM